MSHHLSSLLSLSIDFMLNFRGQHAFSFHTLLCFSFNDSPYKVFFFPLLLLFPFSLLLLRFLLWYLRRSVGAFQLLALALCIVILLSCYG